MDNKNKTKMIFTCLHCQALNVRTHYDVNLMQVLEEKCKNCKKPLANQQLYIGLS
jgi:transcription elongation factor Elf1